MKKKFSITIMAVLNYFLAYGQTNSETEMKVKQSKEILFYGYDLSELRIADEKRSDQDLKTYLFKLTGFLQEHLPKDKMEKWIKKENVTYNLLPTMVINKAVANHQIVTTLKHIIPKDSIQSMIDKYILKETEGIGYVFIFECFDSPAKEASAYSVFFDIATKKILLVDYIVNYDSNSFNPSSQQA